MRCRSRGGSPETGPMDGPDVTENTARTIDYCLQHPQWRLSLQTHKTLGIR